MKESILWPILHEARTLATNGTTFDVDKFHNKFARLIVNECIQVAGDNATQTPNPHMGMAKLEVVKAIIRHFGVTE